MEKYGQRSFDTKKTIYFSGLAMSVLSAMRLHRNIGLLWKRKDGRREWGNVTEHCLVTVARVDALGDLMKLSGHSKHKLRLAAALHDYYKKSEILAMKAAICAGASGAEVSNASDAEGKAKLRAVGISEGIIEIAAGVGGKPPEVFAIDHILEKKLWDDHDTARLILHYVDGYTRDAKWVEPAKHEDGIWINEVDRRTQKNLANETYRQQNLDLIPLFAEHPKFCGRGAIENEGVLCHMIEDRLAARIAVKGEINAIDLPEIVDYEIKRRIEEKA